MTRIGDGTLAASKSKKETKNKTPNCLINPIPLPSPSLSRVTSFLQFYAMGTDLTLISDITVHG